MRRAKQCDCTFRSIKVSDIPQIESLQTKLFPVQYTPAFYQKLFTDGYYCIIAVTDDNKCIGVATGRIVEEDTLWPCTWLVNKEGYIMTFGVSDTHRSKGIGSALIERMCETLEAAGCKYISLHVKTDNEIATKFYKKHAFVQEEELQNYYLIDGKTYNAYKMGKAIKSRRRKMYIWRIMWWWGRCDDEKKSKEEEKADNEGDNDEYYYTAQDDKISQIV